MRGGRYSGNLDYQSSRGRYWSRRLRNATFGYSLFFDSGSVLPQDSRSRGDGFTARCLALEKQANSTLTSSSTELSARR